MDGWTAMFGIGWQEMFIVGLLAIIVIGPKDLPSVLKTVARMIRKVRRVARDFQDTFDEVVREAELDDLKKQVERAGSLGIGQRIADHADLADEVSSTLNKDILDIQGDLDASGRVEREANAMKAEAPKSAAGDPGDKDEQAS